MLFSSITWSLMRYEMLTSRPKLMEVVITWRELRAEKTYPKYHQEEVDD